MDDTLQITHTFLNHLLELLWTTTLAVVVLLHTSGDYERFRLIWIFLSPASLHLVDSHSLLPNVN